MNARRAVLAAVAAWLVVVVVGSTLAWAVISRAGEEVGGDPLGAPAGTERPSTAETPTISKQPTTDPTSGPSSTPGSASTSTSTSTPPAAAPVRRTWQGLGGYVVVACRGAAGSLIAAQADSGFFVEVNDRGPDRVEVEFEGHGDHDDEETRVRAFCVSGTPTFEVDTDSS